MTLHVEELDEETRHRLGLEIKAPIEQMGERLIVLGKVFRSLKGMTGEGAIWILQQALLYVLEQNGQIPDINERDTKGYVPPIGWTIQVVSDVFKVSITDLKRRVRTPQISLARQVCMYLLYKTQKYSLIRIGHHLGDRSPATVSYGFQSIALKLQVDSTLKVKIDHINKRLLIE